MRSFSIRTALVLWDYLLFRGEILFFHLLLAVFSVMKENEDSIEPERIFESIKKIILENEHKILLEIENSPHQDFDILAIISKQGIKFN